MESRSNPTQSITLSQFFQALAFMLFNGVNAFFYISYVPPSSRYSWWALLWIALIMLVAWVFFRYVDGWQVNKRAT